MSGIDERTLSALVWARSCCMVANMTNAQKPAMKYCGIPYLALDGNGREIQRSARLIDELPTPEARLSACQDAAQGIAKLIGRTTPGRITFGTPAYLAFGMTRAEAKAHEHAEVLLKSGGDISLLYCQ